MDRLVALALVASLVNPPMLLAQGERSLPGIWSCMTESDAQHTTVYMTPLWETTAQSQEVSNGFAQLLLEKYRYKGRIFCSRANPGPGIREKLEGDQTRYVAQLKGAGKTVVLAAYRYDPASTSLAFACSGFSQHMAGATKVDSVFLSHVFRVAGDVAGPMSKAWNDYLVASHHADPAYAGGCALLPPDPAEHAARIAEFPKAWNSPSPVVMTLDWQYSPAAAAAIAEADAKPAYYCEMTGSKPRTWFVTAVIPAAPDFPRFEAQGAWQQWVRANLDADAYTGGCDQGSTQHETLLRNNRIEGYRNQGYTVKEVSWTYTGGPAPAPSAATPAASPASSAPAVSGRLPGGRLPGQSGPQPAQPFYCQYIGFTPDAQGKYPLYQNAVFTAAMTQGEAQQAWARYVDATYHPGNNGNATCALLPTDPAQQKTVLTGMMAVPQTTMKVVKVTWKP